MTVHARRGTSASAQAFLVALLGAALGLAIATGARPNSPAAAGAHADAQVEVLSGVLDVRHHEERDGGHWTARLDVDGWIVPVSVSHDDAHRSDLWGEQVEATGSWAAGNTFAVTDLRPAGPTDESITAAQWKEVREATAGKGSRNAAAKAVEGVLSFAHGDDFDGGAASDSRYFLADQRGRLTEVAFERAPSSRLSGRPVTLAGVEQDGRLLVAADGTSPTGDGTVSATASPGTGDRRVAVILVNFTNDVRQPWTSSQVADLMFGSSASVNAYYQEVSYGSTNLTGDVFDWVTIDYDNTGCKIAEWATAADQASGVDTADYQHVVYAFPKAPDCYWAGMANLLGKVTWINGSMTVKIIAHELGHNMGAHHANRVECTDGGVRVTLSATCRKVEYGDVFSIMGSGTKHHNAFHRGQLGWLPELVTITGSGSYTVTPASLTAPTRLYRIARGDGTFLYFEFRQPYGTYDNFQSTDPAVNGVLIRLGPETNYRTQTYLLDMTPETKSYFDAALLTAQSFTDPLTGIGVTTTAVSPAGATIQVSFPGPLASTAPSATPAPTSTPSPTQTAAPSPEPSATPAPSATPEPSATPSGTLSAPTDLVAVQGKGRNVAVTWVAASGPVVTYAVYRDGALVAVVSGTSFADSVPGKYTAVTYVVVARDASGQSSPPSTPFRLTMRKT